MKTLGIIVAAAMVLIGGLPPIFGYIAAAQIEDGLAELEMLGIDAQIRDYERGWYRSRARLTLDAQASAPDGLAQQGVTAELFGERPVFVVDLAHGPVAVLDGISVGTSRFVARLDPASAGVAAAEERLGIPYLFEFRGRVSFLGTVVYDATVPAIDAALGPSNRLVFSGLDADGTYTRGRLVAAVASESLAIVTADGTLSFDVLAVDLNHDLQERTGGGSMSLGRGSLVDAFGTKTLFTASGLRLESAAAAGTRPELRDASLGFTAESIDVASWHVTGAELALDLRNVDTAVIEQYAALAGAGSAELVDPAPLVARLLAAGPELELDPLRLRVDEAELNATMLVTANPDAVPPAGALDPLAASAWLNAIDARATLEVGKPLAIRVGALVVAQQQPIFDESITEEQRRYFAEAQAGLLLATLMGQGLLVESGDNYRVELGVRDGSVTVNGQPLL